MTILEKVEWSGTSPQSQSTKPTIGEIEMYLFAQASLRANTKAVPDDQHADHQLRVN